MAYPCSLTRRRFLAGASAGLGGGLLGWRPAGAQITDLRGFDPLWRDADEALEAFFGHVDYAGEGLRIDLPQHADVGSSVPLTVQVDSAMTADDYPVVIHVLAHGNPTPHILSVWFLPGAGRAEFSTRVRLETSQTVTAAAQMSDGRHIRVDRDLSVSFGACGQIGSGSNADIAAFQPKTRVSVPATAERGEIVPVRAVISHPMETGMRLNSTQEWIRKRIISRFGCTYGGEEIFKARLYPAVATNPYFSFYARAEESGPVFFSWYDMTDYTYEDQAVISVA
ncbi:thiosulfate oxidation carrier protein SoxY [Roseitranquillus sediminis]|uniref:thiosulfate oxidation carrier protein SoxY n=1 Tax=Roseitranquillus sediminis TaxID=2809051 RepID=UPI001D0C9A06|nr:thiosulfate oxidation carrier protein SoxY [Roseitranquillus sediminis]MBM9595487.1 thiosulfate oxidation carrier complex protein SoxZ [Roseitranquillus sediminis]